MNPFWRKVATYPDSPRAPMYCEVSRASVLTGVPSLSLLYQNERLTEGDAAAEEEGVSRANVVRTVAATDMTATKAPARERRRAEVRGKCGKCLDLVLGSEAEGTESLCDRSYSFMSTPLRADSVAHRAIRRRTPRNDCHLARGVENLPCGY